MTTRSLRSLRSLAVLGLGLGLLASTARADSVAQIASSVRISRSTARLIDPQGRPGMMGSGTRTAVRPGDVLTFIAQFTPVPNGGIRGLGGYVTFYVPRNTEVVGVRLVDSSGATVAPHRGGLAADGAGPRGAHDFSSLGLQGGSLSQLYADTGIFYATDARTSRVPDGSVAAERFLTIFDGIALSPEPTGAGQLRPILGAATVFAHNRWDEIQAYAYGTSGASLRTNGTGHTPDRYGSPVAGPDTWYPFEASYAGPVTPVDRAMIVATGADGPWRRIQTYGSEIGRRGATPPMPDPGRATRVGVPAVDAMGRLLGVALHGDAPLPGYDPLAPTAPYARAVRYAVGELVVGEEYLSEISLRVLDTPLDPVGGSDVVCAEVFGGDASAEQEDGTRDGKDNAWRYFLPAPACVSLDLLFDLDVSRLVALPGDRLDYTITAKNLATTPHTDVTVRHCYAAGELAFVSASAGGARGAGTACPDPGAQDDVVWTIPRLDPGAEERLTVSFTAGGGARGRSTVGRAIFTSSELPAPGFQTVAFTVIESLAVPALSMSATPAFIATPPGRVRYAASIANTGTGPLSPAGCRGDPCRILITLPAGFSYVTGSATIGGASIADPTVTGSTLRFAAGLVAVPAGGSMTLEFDADVAAGTPVGSYTCALEAWMQDTGFGQTVNDARAGLAEVLIGPARSETPTLSGTLVDGDARVCGSTAEPDGTVIRIFSGGVEIARGVAAGGTFCVTVPALYAGQRVSASAERAGRPESRRTAEVLVLARGGVGGPAACSDGLDNDADGLVDFPADPDCVSADDPDEATVPECADGVDNDLDGATDFGDDASCSSLLDDTEGGPADCSNGTDDDADGLADFPDDPGCDAADDPSEADLPQCANGRDDDGDGVADFPLDPECTSALDDDEAVRAEPTTDAGVADAGPVPGDGGGDSGGPVADGGGVAPPPDPGGVDEPSSGCGCVAAGARHGDGLAPRLAALIGLAAALARRRRKRGSRP